MGRTLKPLAEGKLTGRPIFPNRFVIEVCEKMHTHYRNLRLVNSLHDWVNMAEGFRDALDRWKKRGCPSPHKASHIELCRKVIRSESEIDSILVNLNKNLYPDNEGRIFSDGAEFNEENYVHLKIGDIRVELSIQQFKEVADVIAEAKKRLEDSSIVPELRETGIR